MNKKTLFSVLVVSVSLLIGGCGASTDSGSTTSTSDQGSATTVAESTEAGGSSSSDTAASSPDDTGDGTGDTQDNTGDTEAATTAPNASTDSSGVDLPLSDMNPHPRDDLGTGGSLRFAISLLPTNWLALNVDGNTVDGARIANFVGAGNWIYGEDASYVPDEDFLLGYEVSEATDTDPQVVTLHLNPEAKWNNGDVIDWEDYQATWQACNGENEEFNCASTDGFNQIDSVEMGDEPTDVVVTFKTAYPDWSGILAGVFPKEGVADPATFNDGWAGDKFNPDWQTGPYAFDSLNESEKILTLVPNPEWWGDPPLLDQVSFRQLDTPADVQAFANGEVDVVETMIDSNSVDQAKGRTDGAIRTSGSLQWRHFTMNSTNEHLTDEAVRQAIQMATNREAIAQSDLAGLPVDAAALMLGNHFFMPGQQGYVDNSGPWAYDPDGAAKLLDGAGWTLPDGGKVREKDGQQLVIPYAMLTGVPTSENEGKLLQSDLAAVGIQLDLVNTPSDDFVATITDGDFGIIAFTWQGTNYPMANVRQIYGAAAEGSSEPSESNFARLINPKIEDLIPQIDTESDLDKRIDLTNEADVLIWEEGHTLPIYRRQTFTAVPDNLANFGASTFQMSSLQTEDIGYLK